MLDGYSTMAAGAALLPLPIVIALASSTMGRIAVKSGACLPLTMAPLVVAAGFFLVTRIDGRAPYWSSTLPVLLLAAFGVAGAVAPLATAVLSSVDAAHTGVASAFNSAVTLRRLVCHVALRRDAGGARRCWRRFTWPC
ncbi:MAG: hypothetical protein H7335_16035 [Massilia sp.]|nr:hypothetical protein [Massilia sp.]